MPPALKKTLPILAIILGALIMTLLIRMWDLDMRVANYFYDDHTEEWSSRSSAFWGFIYKYSFIPSFIISLFCLIALFVSIGKPKFSKWRKVYAYLALVMIIGAGIISNLILKNNWGRPRPSEVLEFGGKYAFEPVFTIDTLSTGKSFPSGHASMGYFLIAFGVMLWSRNKKLGAALTIVGLILGSLIGTARIAQGGHFLSDVVWAGAIMWTVSIWMKNVFKLDQSLSYNPSANKSTPKWVPAAAFVTLVLLVTVSLTAWPYFHKHQSKLITQKGRRAIALNVDFPTSILIKPGDEFKVMSNSTGFGFPKSEAKAVISKKGLKWSITPKKTRGFFTELNTNTIIYFNEPPKTYKFGFTVNTSDKVEDIKIHESITRSSNMHILAPPSVPVKVLKEDGTLVNIGSREVNDKLLYTFPLN